MIHSGDSSIRIVALGDSLTVGHRCNGSFLEEQEPAPYTSILNDRIIQDFASRSLSVEVVNRGVNGELTEQMLSRFNLDVLHLLPKIVIILGGSNDLGWGVPPREVFSNLLEMYELSSRSGIAPIACTVPSILGFDAGIPPRVELNELIRQHCQMSQISLADLFSATMDPQTRRLDVRYSSDGLHLNAKGYGKIGEAIYEDALYSMLSRVAL